MTIDRLLPSRRPNQPVVGFQSWRQLLFAHWPVAADRLQSLLPAGLTVDTHDGVAYVGLVPFVMRSVRPATMPRWTGLNFLETNLRTYVHVNGRDPGVYFFSLDASSRIAVTVAQRRVGLPYHLAWMRSVRRGSEITYGLRRLADPQARLAARYQVGPPLGPSAPGTLQHFLLERYFLHVERSGVLWTLQVHHTPYPARSARVLQLREGLLAAAGLAAEAGLPPVVHWSEGVDVAIFGAWRRHR